MRISLVDKKNHRNEEDRASQEDVGKRKVVPHSFHHLHCLVGVATMEENRVIEYASSQSKVKDVLVPADHWVNVSWTHIVELHTCKPERVSEWVSVCVRERERESVCVCVCEKESE